MAAIRARIKQMGSVNVAAVDEYRQTMERYEQMSAQRDDLVKAQLDLQGIIDELLSKMETQFINDTLQIQLRLHRIIALCAHLS